MGYPNFYFRKYMKTLVVEAPVCVRVCVRPCLRAYACVWDYWERPADWGPLSRPHPLRNAALAAPRQGGNT